MSDRGGEVYCKLIWQDGSISKHTLSFYKLFTLCLSHQSHLLSYASRKNKSTDISKPQNNTFCGPTFLDFHHLDSRAGNLLNHSGSMTTAERISHNRIFPDVQPAFECQYHAQADCTGAFHISLLTPSSKCAGCSKNGIWDVLIHNVAYICTIFCHLHLLLFMYLFISHTHIHLLKYDTKLLQTRIGYHWIIVCFTQEYNLYKYSLTLWGCVSACVSMYI